MGSKQLAKLNGITESRNLIADQYAKILDPFGMKRQNIAEGVYHNIQ